MEECFMKNNSIYIVAQAFYGNRTATEINSENIDRFILGYLDSSIKITEKIDRTIVRVPNTENIVIVYNKYEEEKHSNMNPLAIIPENNINIYSRCIVCRMNDNGEFESLESEDYDKFMKYLAE
jgi:hypothetical protein